MTPRRRSSWRIRWRPTRAVLPARATIQAARLAALAAGADHGVPVDVGIRLDQAVEPHDHVQQDVADHADPHPAAGPGSGCHASRRRREFTCGRGRGAGWEGDGRGEQPRRPALHPLGGLFVGEGELQHGEVGVAIAPTSCMPIGRPAALKPTGTLITGSPASVHGVTTSIQR